MYGIVWGLAGGTVLFLWLRRWDAVLDRNAALVLGAMAAPMTLDWTLHAMGWWDKTPVSRFSSGLLFGLAAGYFLARAMVNMFASPSASETGQVSSFADAT
ncbi:MAG: hypothetical protein BRD40_02055 [Bacteroidetes bacterium QS_1_65_9]|nr:MAG: hypothetical protein BRD40_02055 [Bacteroidetes bacterium QS_1_65_9]